MKTAICAACGRNIIARHTGRKRRFCSDRCRDQARRTRFVARLDKKGVQRFKKGGRYPHSGVPRNAGNPSTISNGCKADLAGRGSAISGLWRRIVEVEIIEARTWQSSISRDGVKSEIARAERTLVHALQTAGFAAERVSLSGAMRGRFGSDLSVPLLGVDRRCEVKVRGHGFIQLYGWLEGGADLSIVRADRRTPLVIVPWKLAVEIATLAERGRTK